MSDEQHKARLKHAAEVLGWLAKGKELEWKDDGRWAPVTPGLSPAARVDYIIQTGEVYRIKPEPVEHEGVVNSTMELPQSRWVPLPREFPVGSKVKITLLES